MEDKFALIATSPENNNEEEKESLYPQLENKRTRYSEKRNDLQGIRGIAVLSVLGFHFYPQYFPNGYFGVDQFFVLSGFLMTMIFGSKPISHKSMAEFYYRRIKRIVPLYALIVFIVLSCILLFFPQEFVDLNSKAALRSISFTSNIASRSDEHDYFIELEQADDVFTHTWSLSVEIQFYLFVPLIFIIYQYVISRKMPSFAHLYLGLMAVLSLLHHIYSEEAESFNSVFARYWQFYVGIEAYFCSNLFKNPKSENANEYVTLEHAPFLEGSLDEESEDDERNLLEISSSNEGIQKLPTIFNCIHHCLFGISLLTLLAISLIPTTLPERQARFMSTLATGIVILTGTSYGNKNIIANKKLVLIGDISYALYLIHWPIVVWIKFNYPDVVFAKFIGAIVSISLACLVYKTYERWYLSLERIQISILIVALYGLILVVAINSARLEKLIEEHEDAVDHIKTGEISRKEAIRLNKYWVKAEGQMMKIKDCYPNRTEHGFCSFDRNEKGKYRMLVLGNSYAANMGGLFHEYFGEYAYNMSKYSYSYCEALIADKRRRRCQPVADTYLEVATQFQPDFLFLVAKSAVLNTPIRGVLSEDSDDEILQEAFERLQKYEAITKYQVFVIGTIPIPIKRFLEKFTQKIVESEEVHSSDYLQDKNYVNGIKRNEMLEKMCSKCTILPFGDAFFAVKPYEDPQFFDPKTLLGYFFNGQHITPAGQDVIRPILKNELKRLKKLKLL